MSTRHRPARAGVTASGAPGHGPGALGARSTQATVNAALGVDGSRSCDGTPHGPLPVCGVRVEGRAACLEIAPTAPFLIAAPVRL
jgi:hypothetical protein